MPARVEALDLAEQGALANAPTPEHKLVVSRRGFLEHASPWWYESRGGARVRAGRFNQRGKQLDQLLV